MTREERAYHYASKKNPSKFTVGEIAKHYDDGYVDGQKDTIDKACEWLNNFYSEDRHCFLVAEDIKDFKKAMEE